MNGMKKCMAVWVVALLASFVTSSCKDDDETVLTTDCYITSVTLGYVKRTIYTKTSDGRSDSSYTVSYNGSYYPMRINQLDGTIENTNPLLTNSQLNAVLLTIEASGTVAYRKAEPAESEWHTYSSTDSVDASTPLVVRVYSQDYTFWRDYTMKVNVHQKDPDAFTWSCLTPSAPWNGATRLKTLASGELVWTFANTASGLCAYTSRRDNGTEWTKADLQGCEGADPHTLVPLAGQWLMNDDQNRILASDNLTDWHLLSPATGKRMLVADGDAVYALDAQGLWRSVDGLEWQAEPLDTTTALLPTIDLAATAYEQRPGFNRIIVIGNRPKPEGEEADAFAQVWSRNTTATTPQWAYFCTAPDNHYGCPRLSGLRLTRYDGVLLAMGGASADGNTHSSMEGFYVSQDNGITWKTGTKYVLPTELIGYTRATDLMTDNSGYLWIATAGAMWRGRLNSLGDD